MHNKPHKLDETRTWESKLLTFSPLGPPIPGNPGGP